MPGNEESRLTERRILIVDDDHEVMESINQALLAEGALTLTCGDGNSAVRICETDAPELVVLDMMLPKRSGFLVLERLKKLARIPKIIMVTANEGRRHQQYAEALGVDGYLLKPVRLERLITLIQELLAKVPRTKAPTPAAVPPAAPAPVAAAAPTPPPAPAPVVDEDDDDTDVDAPPMAAAPAPAAESAPAPTGRVVKKRIVRKKKAL